MNDVNETVTKTTISSINDINDTEDKIISTLEDLYKKNLMSESSKKLLVDNITNEFKNCKYEIFYFYLIMTYVIYDFDNPERNKPIDYSNNSIFNNRAVMLYLEIIEQILKRIERYKFMIL